MSVSLVRDDQNKPQFFISQMQDITDRVLAYNNLHESEQRLELAIGGAELGTWDWNIKSGHVIFNKRWASMLGYTLDEIEPNVSTQKKLLHPDENDMIMKALSRHLRAETDIYETRHRLRHEAGHWIWVLDKGKVIERDEAGNAIRACGTHLDITERKEHERRIQEQAENLRIANEQLDRLAHIDALTGLYNRRAFTDRLNEKARRASRDGTSLAIMMIDIDNFKFYNDTFGHPEGDLFLQQFANLLKYYLRSNDIVARTGGEEFMIILPATSDMNAVIVSEKLCKIISDHPWTLRPMTASVGLSSGKMSRDITGDIEQLIKSADEALYYAKRHGKNQVAMPIRSRRWTE